MTCQPKEKDEPTADLSAPTSTAKEVAEPTSNTMTDQPCLLLQCPLCTLACASTRTQEGSHCKAPACMNLVACSPPFEAATRRCCMPAIETMKVYPRRPSTRTA